jgi:Flp pilus assembly protein TadD
MKKTVIISAILMLIGCAVAIMQQNQPTESKSINPDIASIPKNQNVAFANKYGNYLAGRTASINGDHQKAALFLGHIASLEKNNLPKTLGLLAIRHYLIAGDIEKAIDLSEKNPKSEQNLLINYVNMLQIVQALKNDDVDAAQKITNKLDNEGLASLINPFIQSWLDFSSTKKIERVKIADGLEHGKLRALQYHHEALQLQINQDAAKVTSIYDKIGNQIDIVPNIMIFSAVRHFIQINQPEKAKQIIIFAQKNNPRNPLWEGKNTDNLIEELKDWNEISIQDAKGGIAEAFANIGELLGNEGATSEAIILLHLSLYLNPQNQFNRLVLAEILENEGKYQAAINEYQKIEQPVFLKNVARLYQARALHSDNKIDESRTILQSLLNNSDMKYNSNMMLGDLERESNNLELAIKYYSDTLKTIDKPKQIDWGLLFRRGIIYDLMGDWEKSEADLKQALKLNPNEPEIMNQLGYSWLLRGEKFPDAEKILKQAALAAPDNAHIIDSYGWALYKSGKYEKAFQVLERALSLMPADPTINDHYGDALWQLGRKGEAKFHWERALLYKPTEKGAKAALKAKLINGLKNADAQD